MECSAIFQQYPILSKVREYSTISGIECYVVGGFVRDFLLGNSNDDIDICVIGSGIEFASGFAKFLNIDQVEYFKNYGTANFNYNNIQLEFVGARKESYARNSRNPIVEDGTLADDLMRRDFTLNALAVKLGPTEDGKLIDLFNGISDLNNGILRTPRAAESTFSDDPLRILRAIRFASKFNFTIEENTLKAIKSQRKRITILTQSRILTELNKMLLTSKPSVAFKLMEETGVLSLLLPELTALKGVESVEENGKKMSHKDNFYHTLQVIDNVRAVSEDLKLLWVAVLHDIGKASTKKYEPGHGWTFWNHEQVSAKMLLKIFERLNMPTVEWLPEIKLMVENHGKIKNITFSENNPIQASDSSIRRFIVETGPVLDNLIVFCKCDITTRDQEKRNRVVAAFDRLILRIHEINEKDNLRNFKVAIDGNQIMQLYNIPAGSKVGKIKNLIREAVLDGHVNNDYSSCVDYINQHLSELI